jgi:transcriptional antiterminator NusG
MSIADENSADDNITGENEVESTGGGSSDSTSEDTSVEAGGVEQDDSEEPISHDPLKRPGVIVIDEKEAEREMKRANKAASKKPVSKREQRAKERKAQAESSLGPSESSDLKWYVVHAYSGFEFKAKEALEERVQAHNLSHLFGQILVPQETVVELVRGQKRTTNRKFWPGYILVQMKMNQDTWHLVKETPKITGFVGDASDPEPLSDEEAGKLLSQVEEGSALPKSKAVYTQGDTIKVIDGPFAEFNGTIEEVRPDKGKVKVLISIFGRATPVELEFYQIERA